MKCRILSISENRRTPKIELKSGGFLRKKEIRKRTLNLQLQPKGKVTGKKRWVQRRWRIHLEWRKFREKIGRDISSHAWWGPRRPKRLCWSTLGPRTSLRDYLKCTNKKGETKKLGIFSPRARGPLKCYDTKGFPGAGAKSRTQQKKKSERIQ